MSFSKRVKGLSPTKQRLLELVVSQRHSLHQQANGVSTQVAQPVGRDAPLPLSFAQQRLWFLDQLTPDSPAYNIYQAFHLTGPLNPAALDQSLNEVIRRHEILRTTFVVMSGEPAQSVTPATPNMAPTVDLSGLPSSAREKGIKAMIAENARRPFNLTRLPLLRIRLLRLNEQEHVISLTIHHIISDGWSAKALIREISTIYEAFSNGRSSPLRPLRIQYGDVAHWQRQRMQGEVLERLRGYWGRRLGDNLPLIELPTDYPRPPIQSYKGAREPLAVPYPLARALSELSQRESVTLFTTLLATFLVLLHRYTCQEDMIVSCPIANRHGSESEELIGLFVNTLVVRVDLSGNPTFKELLKRVQKTAFEALEHQDMPFEKLIEELQLERNPSHAPLSQVMFGFQQDLLQKLELPNLTVIGLETHNGTSKRDLTMTVLDKGNELSGSLEYSTDIFEDQTIKRMEGHWETVLRRIVAEPNRRLSDLALLTSAEQHQLLIEWNDTRIDHPLEKPLHRWFEMQVERTPDRIAVVCDREQVSYGQLNESANQLARYLKALGVGPQVLVGICLDRGVEMTVGLLSILKAGGAYLPLDPLSPKERMSLILEEAGPRALLTLEQFIEFVPQVEVPVVCLDGDWDAIARESKENLVADACSDHLVYVLYTSGSTGKPRGVLVEHRQLLNYTLGMIDRLSLTEEASYAMVQPLTVDSCNTMIYPSWLTGGRLHMVPYVTAADASRLTNYFNTHRIDHLKIAPSHLATLRASSQGQAIMPGDRLVIGGETSHWDFVQSLQAQAPECVIFNHYGPTEATVGVLTCRLAERQDRPGLTWVPLGRPLANTEVYVLDVHANPMPIGIPGELHIGGENLARGYLNQPELTAEKFVPHPFSQQSGARIYKTGDLSRYLPDGSIEFLGRIDYQVKIHGFRVELGEIEVALSQHPAVQSVVATTWEPGPGDQRIIAYVVPAWRDDSLVTDLRRFLEEKLPHYMVPSTITLLEELPHTPHGKIDRRALPLPTGNRPVLDSAYVAPQTEVERQIAAIWQDALQIEKVGVNDNYFELGGNSLLMVRVHSKLQETLNRRFPLIRMFNYPTINLLAQYLSQKAVPGTSIEQSRNRARKQQAAIRRQQNAIKASQQRKSKRTPSHE